MLVSKVHDGSIFILLYSAAILVRGTQREHSSKPLKHSIVKRVLAFKRWI